jgi:hypothetical protein
VVPAEETDPVSFRVVFWERDFARKSQPTVEFEVEKMKWTVDGGADEALLRGVGRKVKVGELDRLLRCAVVIYNSLDKAVWWGFVNAVNYGRGKYQIRVTLDEMFNRVAVRYTMLAPAGQGGELCQTEWANDLKSQAEYGVKELILERDGIDEQTAMQERDMALAEHSKPWAKVSQKKMDYAVRLECKGWMDSLKWKFVQPMAGMIANAPGQVGVQWLGNTYSDLWLAQSITPIEDIAIQQVEVRLRKEGSPTDDARIQVQTDNNGVPSGTSLGQVLVSPSIIEAEGYAWVQFRFDPSVEISQGVKVWLVLGRSGQPSQVNFYLVGVDENMAFQNGVFRIYNHVVTSWIKRNPDCDLLFRVTATQDTGVQMEAVFADGNQFLDGMVVEETGVESVPYLARPMTCYAQLLRLLKMGTISGRKLIAEVNQERKMAIREQEEEGENDFYVDEEGMYYDHLNNRMEEGMVPLGRWVKVKGLIDVSANFVSEAEWRKE